MDEWFRPMVQAWRAAGILPVFAAGNGSGAGSIYNPANYPESLSVASVDRSKKRSSFSSQGPAPYPEIIKPDLVAPGENIPSTKAGGGYGLMSGTSMATPHVAGVAALLLAENPALEPDSPEAALRQTAQPLTDACHLPTAPTTATVGAWSRPMLPWPWVGTGGHHPGAGQHRSPMPRPPSSPTRPSTSIMKAPACPSTSTWKTNWASCGPK